jgi:hypothetical protein
MKTKPAGFGVLYASVGCLSDSSAGPFDTIEDAAEYVLSEWDLMAPEEDDEDAPERPTVEEIAAQYGAEDPSSPDSLYSWEIVPLSADECAEWEAAEV